MSLQPSSPAVPTQRKGRFHGASINLFYLPVIILLVVFIVYPLVNGFFLSLTNWDGYSPDKSFVGALNYKQLFKDANFKLVLVNTVGLRRRFNHHPADSRLGTSAVAER